jgi:hypothetical protein
MQDVLAKINQKHESEIKEEDLKECGILEEARDILQRENERAEREEANIRRLTPGCKESDEMQVDAHIRRPGILPIAIANPDQSLKNVRKYSLKRAAEAIYEAYAQKMS